MYLIFDWKKFNAFKAIPFRDTSTLILGTLISTVSFLPSQPTWAEPTATMKQADAAASDSDAIFEAMVTKAKVNAAKPYESSRELPEDLNNLDYDTYRLIAFEHEKSIWKNEALPFWLELFHRGYIFRDEVQVSLLPENAKAARQTKWMEFDKSLFQYRGELAGLDPPKDLGYSGIKVIGKFPSSEHPLEIASFLGASYFRAISPGQFYGTSARGLAVDIGLAKTEEFPIFREFWIEQPRQDAKQLKLWALLDSPSVSGAYALVIHPNETMTIDVKAKLFFRSVPEKVGFAPLTSMFMWGMGKDGPKNDPRPRVHDADSLLIQKGENDWIRRSLNRLDFPSLSNYDAKQLYGFGLMQAERAPGRYKDDEAKYHLRPSVWVTPKTPWEDGAVQLLELPSEHEGIDNIGAYWMPKQPIEIGKPIDLEYHIAFLNQAPKQHSLAKVTDFRVDRSDKSSLRLTVVFQGDTISKFSTERQLQAFIDVQRGKAENVVVRRTALNTVEVSCNLIPDSPYAMEMEVYLIDEDELFSESWRYLCPI
ncbi:Glucans biosynthesis protein G precursor [Bremerella volcania]|uniref:Glucans biosynthesis protein G n=1 Tax=Bremerella volcania TaxID=2527984 RepID=A0A518CD00_9BACT|nr:Glucans biosynthesis protein G precursor [Bremerella volcania]